MTNIESIGMDIAIIVAVMTNREIEKMNNHNNNHNNDKNREKANVDSEFVGKIVAIFDDVVEVKDEIGQIHAFKIIGLDIPAEFGDVEGLGETEKLQVGEKVKVNLEKGRLTSIQKFIKGN
ncbi:MAG: hypothetical protein ACRENZ_08345 [Thermodesulfobacteriota bacterium]